MSIQIAAIPGASQLSIDFARGINNLFSADFRKEADIKNVIHLRRSLSYPRHLMADVLQEQNMNWGCGKPTLTNIELLRNGQALAVVTGQQAGLFAGPLYTIYKALTAIKLANDWTGKFGIPIIPIFWLVSEDHDFTEVQWINVIDKDNQLHLLCYQPLFYQQRTPVGAIMLDENLDVLFDELENVLPETEFTTEIVSQLKSCYQPGIGFADACARWLTKLFTNYGVVLVNPADRRIKQPAGTIFVKEIETRSGATLALQETGAKLVQLGYHAQISPQPGRLNIFLLDKGRHRIEVRKNRFTIPGSDLDFSHNELLNLAATSPEKFSPDVVLRPIMQDLLLPTVAYVGGPGEIAYFAQLKGVYELFDLPMPIIYPRCGITIIEEKIKRHLERYDLSLIDTWQGNEILKTTVARNLIPLEIQKHLHSSRQLVEKQFKKLTNLVAKVEPTIIDSLEKANYNIRGELDRVETKILKAIKNRSDTLNRQLSAISNHLYPGNALQERKLNIVNYINKYNWQILEQIYSTIKLETFEHHILYIK